MDDRAEDVVWLRCGGGGIDVSSAKGAKLIHEDYAYYENRIIDQAARIAELERAIVHMATTASQPPTAKDE